MLENCPWASLLTHLLGEQQLGHLYFLKGDYHHLSLCKVCKGHEICLGIMCGQRWSILWIICPLSWWIVGHFSFFFFHSKHLSLDEQSLWFSVLAHTVVTGACHSSFILFPSWQGSRHMALDKTTLLEVSTVAVEVKHRSCINAKSHISSNAKTCLKNFAFQHPGTKQFHS